MPFATSPKTGCSRVHSARICTPAMDHESFPPLLRFYRFGAVRFFDIMIALAGNLALHSPVPAPGHVAISSCGAADWHVTQ